jgi:hypothetical protein
VRDANLRLEAGEKGSIRQQRCHQQRHKEDPQKREQIREIHPTFKIIA